MDPRLESIVRKALADAWASGADNHAALNQAVSAVLQAQPGMTTSEAQDMVLLLRLPHKENNAT